MAPPRPATPLLLLAALLLVVALHHRHACAATTPAPTTTTTTPSSWSPAAFPDPSKDPAACGRPGVRTTSAVCDPDGVLSRQGADVLEGLLGAIRAGASPYARSPCASREERAGGTGGYQVAAAVVRRPMSAGVGGEGADAADRARAFAEALREAWGLGRPGGGAAAAATGGAGGGGGGADADPAKQASGDCSPQGGDGALIFLAVEDRQAYLSTGSQAARKLDDATAAAVLRAMRPPLRRGDYDAALAQAAADVGLALAGRLDPSALPSGDGDGDDEEGDLDGSWGIFLFFAAMFASVFGASWWSDRRAGRRLGDCRRKLDAIRREHDLRRGGGSLEAREYGASPTCPVCLEAYDGGEDQGGEGGQEEQEEEEMRPAADAAAPGQQGCCGSGVGGIVAAPTTSTSTAQQQQQPKPRRKLILPCGHAFCVPCLESWMAQSRSTCPICRVEMSAAAAAAPPSCSSGAAAAASSAPPAPRQQQPSSSPAGPAAAAALDALWYPEVAFRLRRLRALYPDVVSEGMLWSWERDALAGRDFSSSSSPSASASASAALRRHEARDPARRREYERLGSGGAIGGGFGGGGGGGGGGGAGTSW